MNFVYIYIYILISCAGYYLATIVTFQSIQAHLWGVFVCTQEILRLLCNSEAGQRLSAGTLEESPPRLSTSSHTLTHELPPLHPSSPVPAQQPLTRHSLFSSFDFNEELYPENSIKTTYMREKQLHKE